MELANLIPHIEALIFASEKPLNTLEITELVNNVFADDKITLDQVETAIEGSAIYLTVVTAIAGSGRSAECPSVILGNLASGTYAIFYRSPNEQPVRLRAEQQRDRVANGRFN